MPSVDFNRIASNIAGLNAMNALSDVNTKLGISRMRLATGRRINEAADDPAGLTIATKMNARSEGLGQALSNIGDAKNLMSVAEGGLQKINDILVKMKAKATQAASDTLGSTERSAIQSQLTSWTSEINDIVDTTTWNGNKLLDGLTQFSANTIVFQAGAETDAANRISVTNTDLASVTATNLNIGASNASAATVAGGSAYVTNAGTAAVATNFNELGTGTFKVTMQGAASNTITIQLLDSSNNVVQINDGSGNKVNSRVVTLAGASLSVDLGVGLQVTFGQAAGALAYTSTSATYSRSGAWNGDVSSATGARTALTAIDNAISAVSGRIQNVGTVVSRLTFREQTVTIARTNVEAAYNRIMNADMAGEQLEATKLQILQQTAIAMLGQANTAPQSILSLFR